MGLGVVAAVVIAIVVVAFIRPVAKDGDQAGPVSIVGVAPDAIPGPEPQITGESPAALPDATETAITTKAPTRETFLMFPDGFATIAGRASPNATVEIVLAGTTLERITADANGGFGATVFIAPSDQPRRMELIADPDGAAVRSDETYFVQPTLVAVGPEAAAPDPADSVFVAEVADTPEEQTELALDLARPAIIEIPTVPPTPQVPPQMADAVVPEQTEPLEDQAIITTELTQPAPIVVPVSPEGSDPAPSAFDTVADIVAPEPSTGITPQAVAVGSGPVSTPAPAILVADGAGVRVLQPAETNLPPEVLSNVALDTITYDETGDVQLAGRGAQTGFVQIYLDNQPVTTSRIDAQGNWQIDLPEVDTGVYTLRIDEVSEAGEVVSRIETPFQREEAETVAAVFANETENSNFDVAVRTVQPGATLWAIAREQFGSGILYVEVFEANRDRIRDPDLIYPGQIFRIPELAQ